jgi:hypothetical protein
MLSRDTFKHYPRPRENNNATENNPCSGQDSRQAPPKYKQEADP